MTDDMTAGALARLTQYANALSELADVIPAVVRAQQQCERADLSFEIHSEQLEAIYRLLAARRSNIEHQACSVARQLGWQVATYEIAPIARDSGDTAVVWLTGNSMMPPLREHGISDTVWQLDADDLDAWGAYVEAIESRLSELRVYMGAPDYDNALYVVDLVRFEHVEDPEGESLEDEWRKL